MAFSVYVGTVTKRKNSTYVPTTELSTKIDVVLKESCSDYAPVFILENSTNTFGYNYLKWDDWYYFIDDVIREKNHMVTIKCNLDALATYKAYITASTQFVAYDTTANTELVDTRLSIKTTASRSVAYAESSFFETGCILMGIVGRINTGVWAMSIATAKSLLTDIFTNWLDDPDMLEIPSGGFSFTDWDDAVDTVVNNITVGLRQLIATGKAPDCIKSCIYVPVGIDKFTGSNETIWLGDYNTGTTAKFLSSVGVASEVTSVSIPWQASDWRRNAPYHHIYLSLPYVGTVEIPPSEVMGLSSLGIEIHVTQDGTAYYNITGGSGYSRILRFGANCSSNYMIGASNINPLNGAMGAGTVAGAGLAATLASGAVGLAAAGTAAIAGFLNGISSLPTSVGGTGGGAFSDSAVIACFTIFHDTNVSPNSVSVFMGTPTKAVKSLSGLTGYVECRNASVSAPTSESVIQEINNYLNGGIYLG